MGHDALTDIREACCAFAGFAAMCVGLVGAQERPSISMGLF
jgi:hypothetical protein